MSALCQPYRGFVKKLFTLPLEWCNQTFITAHTMAVVKALCLFASANATMTYMSGNDGGGSAAANAETNLIFRANFDSISHLQCMNVFPGKGVISGSNERK